MFWVLFHYLSGSLTRGPIKEFSAVVKLMTFYDEPEPLPVPDVTEPRCERKLAAALTYLFLTRKAQVAAGRGSTDTNNQQACFFLYRSMGALWRSLAFSPLGKCGFKKG